MAGEPPVRACADDGGGLETVLAQQAANHRRLRDCSAARRCADSAGRDEGEDVVACDATLRTRAGHLAGLETVLAQQATHDGRETGAVALFVVARPRRGGRWLGRGRLGAWYLGADFARGAGRVAADDAQNGAHVDGRALLDEYRRHDTVDRCGYFGVDLVGGHLEEGLAAHDIVADLLEPLGDRAIGDRLAKLGHGDVRHVVRPRGSRVHP